MHKIITFPMDAVKIINRLVQWEYTQIIRSGHVEPGPGVS